MLTFAIFLAVILVCVVIYFHASWKILKTFENAGVPYVPALPVLGNIAPSLFQLKQIGHLHQQFYNMFPDAKYFGIFDCHMPIIVIRDPELIRQVAIKNFDSFIDHLGFTTDKDKIFGNSLFQLKGDTWREMRALLSPAFTSSKLKQMFDVVADSAKGFAESLVDCIDRGTTEVEMKDYCGRYTSDIICKYAFGIDIDSAKNPTNAIYRTGKTIFAFDGPLSLRFLLVKSFPWITDTLNFKLFSKKATNFFTTIIKSTIADREKRDGDRLDMLQILLNAWKKKDAKVKVKLDDIMSQSFIFFFGGYETTSSYLSSTLHLLATHPEVQDRLLKEIDEVYEKTKGNPSFKDIQGMEFLERVLLEGGRMYPPNPYIERKCVKRFELPPAIPGLPGFTIEPGMPVYFPAYSLQHDPKNFPDPEKFDPDRFLDSSINYDCGYYMPFGIGRRICIGLRLAMMEMKLLTFHTLARVSFKASDKIVSPMKLATKSWIIMSHNKVWLEAQGRRRDGL